MPKLRCPCGYIHDLSGIPDGGYKVVKHRDAETLEAYEIVHREGFDAPQGTPELQASIEAFQEIVQLVSHLYECPECGRLMWTKNRYKDWSVYVSDQSPARQE